MKRVFRFAVGHIAITGMKVILTYYGIQFILTSVFAYNRRMNKSTRLENNNEVAPSFLKRARCILHVHKCTLAHTLQSWYVSKCYMFKHKRTQKHGFFRINELCPRSANCLLNIFHKIQNYFHFHNYESGRDANVCISVPFLKKRTFFFTSSRKHLISRSFRIFQ
jgi:hypothetical protein